MFFPNLTFEMEKVKYADSIGYLFLVRSKTLIKYNILKYISLLRNISVIIYLCYEMNDTVLADS